jgi:hypothetical protein
MSHLPKNRKLFLKLHLKLFQLYPPNFW